jgi:sugar O-acyltransferase (sialic acid O-acetyltransferase NeuD family)
MSKRRKLVLVGDSVFAQVACEYFRHDSDYDVACFSVERAFLRRDKLCDLPVIAFEELEAHCSPDTHDVYVSVVFTQMNELRARLCRDAAARGYRLASYISSHARIMPRAQLGDHCFVCEHNVLQPYAKIGNNVVLWSGNQISSFCSVGDNCFVLPNSVLFGFVTIGNNCVVGSNVAIESQVSVGNDCFIGPGVSVASDVPDGETVEGNWSGGGDAGRCIASPQASTNE